MSSSGDTYFLGNRGIAELQQLLRDGRINEWKDCPLSELSSSGKPLDLRTSELLDSYGKFVNGSPNDSTTYHLYRVLPGVELKFMDDLYRGPFYFVVIRYDSKGIAVLVNCDPKHGPFVKDR